MAGQKNMRHRIQARQDSALERSLERDERGDRKQLINLIQYFNSHGKEAMRLREKLAKGK